MPYLCGLWRFANAYYQLLMRGRKVIDGISVLSASYLIPFKAKAWLDAHQINYTDRHIVEDNPSAAELAAWHQVSGLPLKKFFNTSGILYKEMNLKDKLPNMSEAEQYDLLASNGMLVKRPLLIDSGKVLVGFKETEWEAALHV